MPRRCGDLRARRPRRRRALCGRPQTLRDLRSRGLRLAVASNGRTRYVETVLATYGLGDLFLERVTADQVGDKTAVLRAYIDRLGTTAAATVMIGDRASDVEAARAVGCRFIGCDYGHGHRDEIEGRRAGDQPLRRRRRHRRGRRSVGAVSANVRRRRNGALQIRWTQALSTVYDHATSSRRAPDVVGDRSRSVRTRVSRRMHRLQTRSRGAEPFLRGLVLGKLNETQLKQWAKDFYYYVEPAIPTIAAWLSMTPTLPDRDAYKLIARNLAGEMGYIKEPSTTISTCNSAPASTSRATICSPIRRCPRRSGRVDDGLLLPQLVRRGPRRVRPGRRDGGAGPTERRADHPRRAWRATTASIRTRWSSGPCTSGEEEHGENAERVLLLCGQTREQQARIPPRISLQRARPCGHVGGLRPLPRYARALTERACTTARFLVR
jgi:hypothetical protein